MPLVCELDHARCATEFLDHDATAVAEFVRRTLGEPAQRTELSPTEVAVRLYYAVRDGIRYQVYGADLSRTGLRASEVLNRGTGLCLHKSIVYAAALRAVGIPSRLILTDVRNHLTSPRLAELIGGDVFHYHCLASVHFTGRWVKATPVFNRLLCRLYGITPLEFDGKTDSLYHAYDMQGRRYMEFVHWHGEFDDLPYETVIEGMRRQHPRLFSDPLKLAAGSLEADASARAASSNPGAAHDPPGLVEAEQT